MSADGNHEDDRAVLALRAALADRAAGYEPVPTTVPTTVPARRRRWLVPVGVAAGVAAVALAVTWVVGHGTPTVPPAATPTPTTATVTSEGEPPFMAGDDGEPLLGCSGGGPGFPPAAMDGALNDLVPRADVLQALTVLPTSLGVDRLEDAEYVLLARWTEQGTERLLIGIGPWSSTSNDPAMQAWWVERGPDGWRSDGGGNCQVKTVARDGGRMATVLAPSGPRAADGSSISVGVTERDCTSGRDVREHLLKPWFVETSHAITVYWPTGPVGGDFVNCLGNPEHDVALELPSPLGDRALLDGSVWPPQQVLP